MSDDLVSAQVIVKPEWVQKAGEAEQEFSRAGFVLGPRVGGSFSISGPSALFERFFAVRLAIDDSKGIRTAGVAGPSPLELPLERIPPGARAAVATVVFSRRPDFGPGANF